MNMSKNTAPDDKQFYDNAFDAVHSHNDEALNHLGQNLADNAQHLLKDGPLPDTLVMIPVAAHQESNQIYGTLAQYANQRTKRPFSVVLNMNHPTGANMDDVNSSLSELNRARKDFPHLDIRHIEAVYDDPVIGRIRGELWCAALLAAELGGTVDLTNEVCGINHDIDLVRLPRRHIGNIQDTVFTNIARSRYRMQEHIMDYDNSAPIIKSLAARMKHAYSADYPNASRAVMWSDTLVRTRDGYFEAGVAMTLGYYAAAGGYDFTDRMAETINLLERGSDSSPLPITSTALETSPRRYIEKLCRDGGDYSEIWTDDNFSAHEDYRQSDARYKDITRDRLVELTTPDTVVLGRNVAHAAIKNLHVESDRDSKLRAAYTNLLLDQHTEKDTKIIQSAANAGVQRRVGIIEKVLGSVIQHPDISGIKEQVLMEALG